MISMIGRVLPLDRHDDKKKNSDLKDMNRCFDVASPANFQDRENGGEKGIRTPERVTPLTVFETAAFDHSAISPAFFKSPITCHSFDVFQVNSVHERKKITFFFFSDPKNHCAYGMKS